MDVVKKALTVTLPAYLAGLPLPDTFEGFKTLSTDAWVELLPLFSTLLLIVLAPFLIGGKSKPAQVNTAISKEKEKVVDSCHVEDIEDMKAYCRCWKSKKFPYCDGAHTAHNKETGDNVGPLLVKKGKK
eukprot:CAMPEP_0182863830 /NCGR_PEP_ID=MMETSP0034_2-20130328/6855_1 /TAXON_ID=156128 /ORGANISM="Nephroselmis pyriformis, Strain CCMP717" /LENGTH=128 /DNA_ID=CAMNT_0024996069 /DNA_START=18 /DNA_END=404 /DNA_ORIENTATION=+